MIMMMTIRSTNILRTYHVPDILDINYLIWFEQQAYEVKAFVNGRNLKLKWMQQQRAFYPNVDFQVSSMV